MTIAPDIAERLGRYERVQLRADLSALSDEDREVLDLLIEASRHLDEIFLRQVGGEELAEMRERLRLMGGANAADALAFFDLNFGPWDRLDERAPFVGDTPHPKGAGYYPRDMTKEEFEQWVADHPEDAEAMRSLTTLIRRDGDRLVAIPYRDAFLGPLEFSAKSLKGAAATTGNASLARFLELRAEAFLTDDYYESDLAWMDVDAPVEITIGPYETYEDELFGYKAAFESFVTVALPEESTALSRFKEELPWLERNLPIPDEHKNLNRGTESPIRVADAVFTSGEAHSGVATLAFNLPNDERVREAKGSKKVLLKNHIQAKYNAMLVPIAQRVLAPGDAANVSFDAFFAEVLHHELAHGLGPGRIVKDGRETEVRLELREHYATIEEAKADVLGVYNIFALIDRGLIEPEMGTALEPTYVAGLFRSARFGLDEAHGQGVVAQFNYLLEKGALEVSDSGEFRVVPELFADGLRDLLTDLLMLQAEGDFEATAAFLERYGKATPALRSAVDRLSDVPVDIFPVYEAAG